MRRLVKVGDFFVHPIDRQGVLNQIVGPDAEKIYPFGQGIGNQGRGRNLDHRADLNIPVIGGLFAVQFVLAQTQALVGLD